MKRSTFWWLVVVGLVLVLLVGAGLFFRSRRSRSSVPSIHTMLAREAGLALDVSALPELDQGVYEAWALFGDDEVSAGIFAVGDTLTFRLTDDDIREADKIVITVEPDPDPDPASSGVVVLTGDVVDGAAALAFPADLASATGQYILGTPTNGNGTDETSGVWFLLPPAPFEPSLQLPTLPPGWVYEAWTRYEDIPLTIGRFSTVTGADDFNDFSGPQAAPAFPGEDFLENHPEGIPFPAQLTNGTSRVFISIEPEFNGEDPTGNGPFTDGFLTGDILSDATDHTPYDLILNLSAIPTGMAEIK